MFNKKFTTTPNSVEHSKVTDKETSLAFVERMEAAHAVSGAPVMYSRSNMMELLRLAKTAALVEEHRLWVEPPIGASKWRIVGRAPIQHDHKDLHTAVRAVADRIKEGK